MPRLTGMGGLDKDHFQKLRAAGVTSSEALLSQGVTPQGRKELAEKTGVSEKEVLEWVNRADLLRVRGIGRDYADLLEQAGVDTVPELAQRNPQHLYEKLVAINRDRQLVRRLPVLAQVRDWVEQAKRLPRLVRD